MVKDMFHHSTSNTEPDGIQTMKRGRFGNYVSVYGSPRVRGLRRRWTPQAHESGAAKPISPNVAACEGRLSVWYQLAS